MVFCEKQTRRVCENGENFAVPFHLMGTDPDWGRKMGFGSSVDATPTSLMETNDGNRIEKR